MAYYQNPWDYESEIPQYQMSTQTQMPGAAPSYTPTAAGGAGATATALPNPYVAAAGLGLGAVGTALNAYGAYEAGKDADKQFELQKENFQFDKALSMQDRLKAEEERKRRALIDGGQYAGNYLDNAINRYGAYNAMTGA